MSLREKIGPLLKHPRNSIRVFFSEERRLLLPFPNGVLMPLDKMMNFCGFSVISVRI